MQPPILAIYRIFFGVFHRQCVIPPAFRGSIHTNGDGKMGKIIQEAIFFQKGSWQMDQGSVEAHSHRRKWFIPLQTVYSLVAQR